MSEQEVVQGLRPEVCKHTEAAWHNKSEVFSVVSMLRGINDADHIRLSLHQLLQYACRLLLANLVLELFEKLLTRQASKSARD